MDIWLSCLVAFYVINHSFAANGLSEEKTIYDLFTNNTFGIVHYIWENEGESFCRIPKPSENSLKDKTFLIYNYNQMLCIILADATTRYLNVIDHTLSSQDEQASFKKIVEQSPGPEKFCEKMKDTNWTTDIESNKKWVHKFNSLMSNETLCRRYCAAEDIVQINPLCAYSLWLDMAVKGEQHQDLQQKPDSPHSVPIPYARSGFRKPNPNVQSLRAEPTKRPQLPRVYHGSPSIASASPSDSLSQNPESLANIMDSIGSEPFSVLGGSKADMDVTVPVASKGPEQLIQASRSAVPLEAKGGNSETANDQTQRQNGAPGAVGPKLNMTQLKPSKTTQSVVEGKQLIVSPSSPGKDTKGSIVNSNPSTPGIVSGRGPDSITQSDTPHVKPQEGNENSAKVPNAVSTMSHEDKAKLGSTAKQSPKHGTDAKTTEAGGKENSGDFTLDQKDHTVEADPKTNVESEVKETGNEGISDGTLQVEPNTHEQKDREEVMEEDLEGMEHPEEQSPEGEVPTTEPRFGGENDDPVNGRNTSPKNFDYDADDDNGLNVRLNEGDQEKVTQNDAGAGMYVHDRFVDAEDSHFFAYFMTMIILCIIGYLIFHNKQKILALALEGRVRKGNRRRPSTSGYRKLDSNLEEAVTSNCAGASVTHVIY